jgi:hypothetical protein
MKAHIAIFATVLSLAAGAAQADYLARNGMIAVGNPARAGYVEVFQRALAGPSDYWCAAGEYVRNAAHQPGTTRMYIVRGLGPSQVRRGRSAVVFSFVKYDDIPTMSDAEKGYSVSDSKPGYNLSAGHATAFCSDSLKKFRRYGF